MRTNKNELLLRSAFMAIIFMLLFIPEISAQDLSDVESEVTNQLSAGKRIIKLVVDFIFAIGAIGVIWAFISKRDDAKNWLIGYFVGIIIWGVVRTMFFTGS